MVKWQKVSTQLCSRQVWWLRKGVLMLSITLCTRQHMLAFCFSSLSTLAKNVSGSQPATRSQKAYSAAKKLRFGGVAASLVCFKVVVI